MKIGDLVVMKQSARKNFYETQKLVECFEFQGSMRPQDFVRFVNEYVGFISKKTGLGRIVSINIMDGDTIFKVEFYGPVGLDFHYFDKKDLRRV